MDTKRLLTGTVVAGLVITLVGFLVYEIALAGFFEAHTLVAARAAPVVWAPVLSALAHGLLITLAIEWSGTASAAGGFRTGATVGFLVWLGADMILYGLFEFSTLTGALADSVAALAQYGIAGAAVGAALGMGGGRKAAAAETPA